MGHNCADWQLSGSPKIANGWGDKAASLTHLEVDVFAEGHAARVDAEDVALRLHVGERKLDLPVDAAGADQGRVQGLDAVRRHDHLRRQTSIDEPRHKNSL